jgi:hypothetical protein
MLPIIHHSTCRFVRDSNASNIYLEEHTMSDPILVEMLGIITKTMNETTEPERIYSEFNKYQSQLTLEQRNAYASELSTRLGKCRAQGILTADRFFNPAINTLRTPGNSSD